MTDRLPPLRRPRRRFSLTRLASIFHEGVAKIEATIEPFARHWDDRNAVALAAEGPLWVALGDSVTQGIGASSPRRSYAALALEQLRRDSGEPWRLINLSMSGARFHDVVDKQLGVMRRAGLEPQLVSALIGSNDVIWRRDTDGVVEDARRLVGALPGGTFLSRVSEARGDRRRLGINSVFDAAAASGRLRLFEAWDWPTGDGMWAEDKFHPNDEAHVHLASNLITAFRSHQIVP